MEWPAFYVGLRLVRTLKIAMPYRIIDNILLHSCRMLFLPNKRQTAKLTKEVPAAMNRAILHISDLHILADSRWNTMRKALLAAVKEKTQAFALGEKMLVVTGDFHNFRDADYDKTIGFLDELIGTMGIEAQQDVFVVPGNHDVKSSAEAKEKIKQQAVVEQVKNDPHLIENRDFADILLERFPAYSRLVKQSGIYAPDADDLLPARVHVRTWRNQLHILHLNTTLVADGKQKTNQLIDIRQATASETRQALAKDGLPVIAIGHNSFYDLHPDQQTTLSALFAQEHVCAYLCGDRHRAERDRSEQFIRLSEGYSQTDQIPNIVCLKTAADVNDDYSDFGFIWHFYDDHSGEVDLVFEQWLPQFDQNAFVSRTAKKAYRLTTPHAEQNDALSAHNRDDTKKLCSTMLDDFDPPLCAHQGREALLEELEQMMHTGSKSVVCLHGFAGEGKSALVYQLLTNIAKRGYCGFEKVYYRKFRRDVGLSDFFDSLARFLGQDTAGFDDCGRVQAVLQAMNRTRTLLVLDNIEALQYPPDRDNGALQSTAMQTFVRKLAREGSAVNSMVLLLSRQSVEEIRFFQNNAKNLPLPRLGAEDCAAIFREYGIYGGEAELLAAAKECACNPYAVVLLARILRERFGGAISRRREVSLLDHADGGCTDPLMDALCYYEQIWETDSPEYELLLLLSLFRHAVPLREVERVAQSVPQFAALTQKLPWACENLRRYGLLNGKFKIDVQPAVREYFHRCFREAHPDAFLLCNRLIAEQCLEEIDDQSVVSIADAAPFYDAVFHYAQAGELNRALDVYWYRLNRRREFFSQKVLGALSSDLYAASSFFRQSTDGSWTLKNGLPPADGAWICASTAYLLNTLGALREAEQLRRREVELHRELGNELLLAVDLKNLSENLILQGKFKSAQDCLREAEQVLAGQPQDKTQSRYAAELKKEKIQNGLYARQAYLSFCMEPSQKENIMESLSKVSDWDKLTALERFHCHMIHICLDGHTDESDVQQMLERGERENKRIHVAYAKVLLAMIEHRRGNADRAREQIDAAVKVAQMCNRMDQLPVVYLLKMHLYRHEGVQSAALRQCLSELDLLFSTYRLELYQAHYHMLLAEMLADAGDYVQAQELTEELMSHPPYRRMFQTRLQACREKSGAR